MAANGISTLMLSSGLTATSYTQASSYLVAVGTFNYDAYGAGFAIRKDGGAIDAYMAQVIALGAGARNWTFVPGNGQPSFTRSMTQPDGTNASNDPGETGVAIWNVTTAAGNLSGSGAGQLNTSLIPNGTSFVIYATELGGGGGADKEARQIAKLDLAQTRRQAAGDTTAPYYRENNTYDIDNLPTKYSGNTLVNNSNPGGLLQGRPWINVASITFTSGVYHRTVTGTTNANGYFGVDFIPANDDLTFFDTYAATSQGVYTSLNLSSLPEYSSIMLTGYFLAPTTDTYTFYTNTDDASYMWIGPDAITGYTHTNAIVKNGGLHGVTEVSGTIAMTANIYYPFRVMFGNLTGPGTMTVSWASGTQAKTSNWSGKLYYNSATNGF
jgi:hypothetical protein